MPSKSANHNNPLNNGPGNKVKVDRIETLDELNLKLLKDLVNDSGIKSAELSKKYQVPLSTIQRRRTKLERSILKKKYEVDFSLLRTRQADLMISVGQGDSEQTAKKVLDSFQDNIISISMRIGDPEINLMSRVIYQSTEELHQLIEGIKSVPSVKSVDWSELVKVVTDRAGTVDGSGRMLHKIFKSGLS